MHLKFAKTAARAMAVSALTVASGLGFAQAALADPASNGINVPCSAAALYNYINDNTGGETLSLAQFCTYKLPGALPDITEDVTINGNQSTIERSYAPDTPDFSILTVSADVDLVLNRVNFRNGSATETDSSEGGAIDNTDGTVTVNGGTFTGNTATYEGGAIYNDADLTVQGASFTGNSTAEWPALSLTRVTRR